MFKKRELKITMDKADKPKPTDETPIDNTIFESRLALVAKAVKDVVKTGAICVAGYVLLDTVRQVAVAVNTNAPQE